MTIIRDSYGRQVYGSQHSPDEERRRHEQDEFVKNLKEMPRPIATVIELRSAHMTVTLGQGNTIDIKMFNGAKVGDRVLLTRDTLQATEVIADKAPSGMIVTAERVTGEIVEGTMLGVLRAFRAPNMKIRKGERVIVDPGMTNVIGTLGMPPASFTFAAVTDVAWDDIGGHVEAKESLREAIELPFAHPELFKAYKKRHVKGVLMSGAPGCGKTMLGKAAATAIARAHGKPVAGGFIYVKGPELLNKYVGNSEESVRALFGAARTHKEKHGFPAVVFIDECDALLGERSSGLNTGVNATGVVQQFLAEMDGLEAHSALFILATNRPDSLDPAVVRDGRVDRKVRVLRPSRTDSAVIAALHLRNRPLAGDGHVERIVSELFSDDRVVYELGEGLSLRLRDLVSGAMIEGVVERASTAAVQRDIQANTHVASGISVEDLVWAVGRAQDGVRDTSHSEVIRDMIKHAGIARDSAPVSSRPERVG